MSSTPRVEEFVKDVLQNRFGRPLKAAIILIAELEDQLTAANLRAETAWERAKEFARSEVSGLLQCAQGVRGDYADGQRNALGQAVAVIEAISQIKEPANGNG